MKHPDTGAALQLLIVSSADIVFFCAHEILPIFLTIILKYLSALSQTPPSEQLFQSGYFDILKMLLLQPKCIIWGIFAFLFTLMTSFLALIFTLQSFYKQKTLAQPL